MTNQTTSANSLAAMGNSPHKTDGRDQTIGGLTCEEFQDQLPELLSAGGATFSDHPHLQGCANCSALVRDLQSIADAARELLPAHDPSPALWDQIQSSLQLESQPPSGKTNAS